MKYVIRSSILALSLFLTFKVGKDLHCEVKTVKWAIGMVYTERLCNLNPYDCHTLEMSGKWFRCHTLTDEEPKWLK